MRAVVKACLQDAEPFLNRVQVWRQRAVLWIFAIAMRGMQRKFEAQNESGRYSFRSEGITRRYLGCRQSLVFYNHFPVLLRSENETENSCADRAVSLILSLSNLVRGQSRFAKLLATSRQPNRHCDVLRTVEEPGHGVVLWRGIVFTFTLPTTEERGVLRSMIEQIMAHVSAPMAHGASAPNRLGELTALPREDWLIDQALKH